MSPRRRQLLVLSLTALSICAACRSPRGETDRSLEPLPHPALAGSDPVVLEQIEQTRGAVETTAADPRSSAADLGRAFGELGMTYHAYRLAAAAIPCYRNAERLDPSEPRWPYYLGRLYRDAGAQDDAIAAFERSVADDPSYVPTLIELGRAESERGRYRDGAAWFAAALDADPDSAAAWVGLGKIALAEGDYDHAVELLEAAVALAPSATAIRYPLGLAYRGLGRIDRALPLLDGQGGVPPSVDDPWLDRVQRYRRDMLSHLDRGLRLSAEGRHAQALAELRRAVEAAPEDVTARTTLGHGLAQAGDLDGARAELERALSLDPGSATAQFNLGTVYAQTGDDERAVAHLRAALDIDPGLVPAHVNLGNALRRLGRFEQALAEYHWVIDRQPGHAAARLNEGLVLIRLQRYAEALHRLDAAREAIPGDRNILQAVVRLLAAAPDDAVRDGRRAERLARTLVAPDASFDVLEAVAMAAAENGDFDAAIDWQSRALAAIGDGAPAALIEELRGNMRGYRSRTACRRPWPDDGPVLAPGPLSR
ncbi:MAG TPA: tetratricopeptide repeat protein [Candidatus Polarisedimenticolaceae bacterium]|nr:tetratricopeptide repeat protein [Candidatus Polarisedimenticolaceae bacterium]